MLRAGRLFRAVLSLNSDSLFLQTCPRYARVGGVPTEINITRPSGGSSRLNNLSSNKNNNILPKKNKEIFFVLTFAFSIFHSSLKPLFTVFSFVFRYLCTCCLYLFSANSLCVKNRALRVYNFSICQGQYS